MLKIDGYETLINFIMRTLLKKEQAILVTILALNFVLRLYGVIVDVDFIFREATYGMAAWRIVDGEMPYRDFFHAQAPVSPFLLAFIFLIFGVGIIQARLFLVVFTTFTCFMIFLVGRKIDYKTGLLGSIIFAVVPFSARYGMMAVNDFIAMTFCVIGYYFLTSVTMGYVNKGDQSAKRNNLVLAGLFVSIGVMIKIIVAPMLLAFIVILFVEEQIKKTEFTDQVKNIAFLILGFIIPILLVFSPFYFLFGDTFTTQVLGQHLGKTVLPWETRLSTLTTVLITENLYFFVFFSISAFFAARKPYGRGLIICILFMVFAVFLFVPRQQINYYQVNVIWMAMVCGFFPFSDVKSLNLRSALLSVIVFLGLIILNFTIFIRFYHPRFYFPVLSLPFYSYPSYYLILLTLAALLIALTVFIVLLIKDGQFDGLRITDSVKEVFSSRHQMLRSLRGLFNYNGVKLGLVVFFILLITVSNLTYPRLSEKDKKAIDWVKANTSPDEYVLADNLKINFRAKRRTAFAEISRERTHIGDLTGEMFVQACYDFDVRVVVNTGFLFGQDDTYDVFLEFLEANYVPIIEGHIIYVRISHLK